MKQDYRDLIIELDPQRLPQHIGIIMDGNGRWAKLHRSPRLYGHRAGARSVRNIIELAVELSLKCITLYAFSTENWNRPQSEVDGLLKLLIEMMHKEINEVHRQNVKIRTIGSRRNVNPDYMKKIDDTLSLTWDNTGPLINVAFNYGSQQEIIEAIMNWHQKANADPERYPALTFASFEEHLFTAGLPPLDLVIRTSGEQRLSNFMLWQAAYAELYFTETLFPDFDKYEFCFALREFQERKRRFGALKDK